MNTNKNLVSLEQWKSPELIISDEVLLQLYNSLPENILLFLSSSFPESKKFQYFKFLILKLLKSNNNLNDTLSNIHLLIPEINRCILKFSTMLTLNIMEISNSTSRKHIKMANFLEISN